MKNIKILIVSSIVSVVTSLSAQNVSLSEEYDDDISSATTNINYVRNEFIESQNLRMKVVEQALYPDNLLNANSQVLADDNLSEATEATKVVYLDNDEDDFYDKFIVIRYDMDYKDRMELEPTPNGIELKIDNELVKNIIKPGFYLTDANNDAYFVVEEFRNIQ